MAELTEFYRGQLAGEQRERADADVTADLDAPPEAVERTRELGMMMALGLRPIAVFRMVYWESVFMTGVGLAIGLALALPTVLYLTGHPIELTGEAMEGMTEMFGMEPIVTFKLTAANPLGSAATILLVGALASLYRNARIRRIHQNCFGRYGEVLSPIVEAVYEFQAVGE